MPPPLTISGRLRPTDHLHGAGQSGRPRAGPSDVPHAGLEEFLGPVVGLRLDVLGQGDDAAPVSAGSVSTRIAPSSADGSCSGRHDRSKNRATGRKESLTEMSFAIGCSSCWSTGSATRVANRSLGRRSTGSRLTVAVAAPVTMLVAPGPIDDRQAMRRQSVSLPREPCRRVDHPLLIAALVVRHRVWVRQLLLEQRLAQARDVAMPEDAEHALDQPVLHAVTLASLRDEEADDRLSDSQTHGGHGVLPSAALAAVNRGSTA